MLLTPITVVVPEPLIRRCSLYGRDVARSYAMGDNEKSRTTGINKRAIYDDARVQGMARLCEVAGAMAVGVDPEELNWDPRACDDNWDFGAKGLRIDVKGCWHPKAQYLIYPASKRERFAKAQFDALMFVWAVDPEDREQFGYCEARGWLTKEEFTEHHHVVTEEEAKTDKRFIAGSMILHQDRLRGMEELHTGAVFAACIDNGAGAQSVSTHHAQVEESNDGKAP